MGEQKRKAFVGIGPTQLRPGMESFRSNPWVAAIGFRVVKANIDARAPAQM